VYRLPLELGQPNELAVREQIPAGVHNEGTASTARRNVAHEESRGRCNDSQDDVGEVGDHELAPRLLIELVGALERQQVRRGERHPPTMPR
jgi:hypothetical protein